MQPRTIAEVLARMYVLPDVLRMQLALGRRVSLLALVTETGYPAMAGQIDVAQLGAGLRERDDVLRRWLRYSADKEANWGWFFERERDGTFAVGLKSGYSEETRCELPDGAQACALFIKRELDAILGLERTRR